MFKGAVRWVVTESSAREISSRKTAHWSTAHTNGSSYHSNNAYDRTRALRSSCNEVRNDGSMLAWAWINPPIYVINSCTSKRASSSDFGCPPCSEAVLVTSRHLDEVEFYDSTIKTRGLRLTLTICPAFERKLR